MQQVLGVACKEVAPGVFAGRSAATVIKVSKRTLGWMIVAEDLMSEALIAIGVGRTIEDAEMHLRADFERRLKHSNRSLVGGAESRLPAPPRVPIVYECDLGVIRNGSAVDAALEAEREATKTVRPARRAA